LSRSLWAPEDKDFRSLFVAPPALLGNRPVIILSRDSVLENIGSIVVALVTRTIRQLPTEVALGRRQGLPLSFIANLDNLLTVSRHRSTRLMRGVIVG
jgi:mRNA-degrading endonuclease toxin of MazEF toxin-antitoxin module